MPWSQVSSPGALFVHRDIHVQNIRRSVDRARNERKQALFAFALEALDCLDCDMSSTDSILCGLEPRQKSSIAGAAKGGPR